MWDFYWEVQLGVLSKHSRYCVLHPRFCFEAVITPLVQMQIQDPPAQRPERWNYQSMPQCQCGQTTFNGKTLGLVLICYWGLNHSILQCLGLNIFQSLNGKLLLQDGGRLSLNQEAGEWRRSELVDQLTLRPATNQETSYNSSRNWHGGKNSEAETRSHPVPCRGQKRKMLRNSGRTRCTHAPVSAATMSEHPELWAAEMSNMKNSHLSFTQIPHGQYVHCHSVSAEYA